MLSSSTIVATVVLEEFRRYYDTGFTKRTLFAILALAIFIPILAIGGLWLQIAMGIVAMLGVHELLRMKGLNTMTPEGLLTLLATFALTVPFGKLLEVLPVDGKCCSL